jgi:NitT/TauT family transport system permease protein
VVWAAHERGFLGLLSVATVLLLWETSARFGWIESRFLVPPSGVIAAGIEEVQQARFWRDVAISLFEFTVGYGLAVLIGVPLGLVLGWYRRLSYLFEPVVNFLYAIPRIALLPIIVVWLGLSVWSKVAVVFLGAFITILLNTYLGVRTVDQRYLAVARTYGASQRRIFTSVVFPASVPFILVGLRLGIGRALIGVIVGELYASNAGLGFMITIASNNLQIDRVLFGTFLFMATGIVGVEGIRRIERRYSTWREDLSTGR